LTGRLPDRQGYPAAPSHTFQRASAFQVLGRQPYPGEPLCDILSHFNLALKCVGDGIVRGFKSTVEDEKGSGIKHSEEESASLWRRYVCICDGSCGRLRGHMSFMTVPNLRWDGVLFLHCDVSFNFVSDIRIKVTSVDVDIIGRIVVLFSQGVKKYINFTFTRAYIHTSNVEWARYQG